MTGLLLGRRFGEALEAVDGLRPIAADPGARLALLLDRWPERAAEEIPAMPSSVWSSQAVGSALSCAALRLSAEAWRGVESALPAELGDQARAIRDANEAICSKRDDDAAALLEIIGIRSPFRTARVFLSGLVAFYTGRDDEALASLSKVGNDGAFGPASRTAAFIAAMAAGRSARAAECATRELNEKCLETWASPQIRTVAVFSKARTLMEERRSMAAFAGLARDLASAGEVERAAARRDAVGHSMLRCDMDARAVFRALKAIGAAPWDKGGAIDQAVSIDAACVGGKNADEVLVGWLLLGAREMVESRRCRAGNGSELRRMAAAMLYRAYLTIDRMTDEASREDAFGCILDDCLGNMPDDVFAMVGEMLHATFGKVTPSAAELLAASVELDPSCADVWIAYLKILRQRKNTAESNAAITECLKLHPDDVEVLSFAARSAFDRKAFDKAREHIVHARKIAPLSRELVRLELDVLLAKARAKADRDARDAHKAYGEAISATKPGSADHFLVEAECALLPLAKLERGSDLFEGLLHVKRPEACPPWSWLGCLALGFARLSKPGDKRRRSRKEVVFSAPLPEKPPTETDLKLLLAAFEGSSFAAQRVPEAFQFAIREALIAATALPRDLAFTRFVLEKVDVSFTTRLAVAQHCLALGDSLPETIAALCDCAHALGKHWDFYERASALTFLDRAIETLTRRPDGAKPRRTGGVLDGFWQEEDDACLLEALREHRVRIERMKRLGEKPARRKGGRESKPESTDAKPRHGLRPPSGEPEKETAQAAEQLVIPF